MTPKKPFLHIGTFLIILCFTIYVWHLVLTENKNSDILKVAFLDIGQGDSIYIEAPNGRQILIDGGRGKQVLAKLSEVMPLGDTNIDVVIGTHPDADHIGGLPFVLEKYVVGAVFEPGVGSKTKTYQSFEDTISQKKIPLIYARRGMDITLDQEHEVVLHILFPDQDVTHWKDTNMASIVSRLTYSNESFLLTADSPIAIEQHLIALDKKGLQTTVLKLGHHGSRTSSSEAYLEAVKPEYAIISAGKNNRYGHPHKEVTDRLAQLSIPSLATAVMGTIIFTTDGVTLSHN